MQRAELGRMRKYLDKKGYLEGDILISSYDNAYDHYMHDVGDSYKEGIMITDFLSMLNEEGITVSETPTIGFEPFKFKPIPAHTTHTDSTREIIPMELKQLCNHLGTYEKHINNDKIQGDEGYVSCKDNTITVHAGRSKRHMNSLKDKLKFMDLVSDDYSSGNWTLQRNPTTEEAAKIRDAVKLYKRPDPLTKEQKKARKEVALKNLSKTQGTSSKKSNELAI